MAIYSTFFLCEPGQLQTALPGWRLPLSPPVTRKAINPFTKKEMTIYSREPEWEDVDPNKFELPEMTVVAIEGDYAAYLEGRIPPFVQSQPHWCAKNLTSVELEPLVSIFTDSADAKLETALYAHPSLLSGIEQFPGQFLVTLRAAGKEEINAIAEKWAAEMSTPDYTHSMGGDRIQDDWTVEDALSMMTPIVELARKAKTGQSMYLLLEG
ncbi:MAG: hypothetical protein K8R36_14800 [Planctomycetales bacterium]|nr:hypothetical protein [Planctomycetales bacterium]